MAVLAGRVALVTGASVGIGAGLPSANQANFLTVEEVVDMVRYLLHTGDNVKLGPQILLRTMRNPMGC